MSSEENFSVPRTGCDSQSVAVRSKGLIKNEAEVLKAVYAAH